MDNCFSVCGCDDYEGVTKSDLDRYTDKIENVLNDEKGRRLFRNFMFSCQMVPGRRVLDLWENIDKLLNYSGGVEGTSFGRFLRDYDRLMNAAERIEELDLATMERLVNARDSENKEGMEDALKVLKAETAKSLRREYDAFRLRFIPRSSK